MLTRKALKLQTYLTDLTNNQKSNKQNNNSPRYKIGFTTSSVCTWHEFTSKHDKKQDAETKVRELITPAWPVDDRSLNLICYESLICVLCWNKCSFGLFKRCRQTWTFAGFLLWIVMRYLPIRKPLTVALLFRTATYANTGLSHTLHLSWPFLSLHPGG
jgi:hypothetical protein